MKKKMVWKIMLVLMLMICCVSLVGCDAKEKASLESDVQEITAEVVEEVVEQVVVDEGVDGEANGFSMDTVIP